MTKEEALKKIEELKYFIEQEDTKITAADIIDYQTFKSNSGDHYLSTYRMDDEGVEVTFCSSDGSIATTYDSPMTYERLLNKLNNEKYRKVSGKFIFVEDK